VNFAQYEKKFRSKAIKSGYSEDEISACLEYAKPLIDNHLPVIYNTANLAALVGYRTNYLKRAVKYTTYYYREFYIKKTNGKQRKLVEPLPSLKEIQIWILNHILYEIKVSRYAKAYVRDRNLLENVKFHKGQPAVFKLDICDFFGSIKLQHVEAIFKELGYSSNVSNLLAKLCCYDKALPQGAPTSPYLSNLYLRSFDDTVSKFCNDSEIRYTRYADDLTFSGKESSLGIAGFIQKKLSMIDLVLNKNKEKLMLRNERQLITGVVVNDKLQTPKKDRNFIRNEVHFLSRFGLNDHLQRTGNNRSNYLAHLLGKINFALHINPIDDKMQGYKEIVLKILNDQLG
jgi:retron-type reverse transcriptase